MFTLGHKITWNTFKNNVSAAFIVVNIINECTLLCNVINKEKQEGMLQNI